MYKLNGKSVAYCGGCGCYLRENEIRKDENNDRTYCVYCHRLVRLKPRAVSRQQRKGTAKIKSMPLKMQRAGLN